MKKLSPFVLCAFVLFGCDASKEEKISSRVKDSPNHDDKKLEVKNDLNQEVMLTRGNLCDMSADLFIAPTGSGKSCSCNAPCDISSIQSVVRARFPSQSRSIVVGVADGLYELKNPLVFTSKDSGKNGHSITYRAAPNADPELFGGIKVNNFVRDTSFSTHYNVYTANIPSHVQSRHLYINGKRATRARSQLNLDGYNRQDNGFFLNYGQIANWQDKLNIEVVGLFRWRMFRCGVSEINTQNGITLKEPCLTLFNKGIYADEYHFLGEGNDAWLENARGFLNDPGEFYIDSVNNKVSYVPNPNDPNESMASADVRIPVLEELVKIEGTLDQPVKNIRFEGLTFSHTTWLAPSGNNGYVGVQGGIHRKGLNNSHTKPGAAIKLSAAENILFTECTFEHLGGAGIDIDNGSKNNSIGKGRFDDISSSAVMIGDVSDTQDHHPDDLRKVNIGNSLKNSIITKTGQEYFDAAAVFVGYTEKTLVKYNEIFDVPYTGVTIGAPWGDAYIESNPQKYNKPTVAKKNEISFNNISYHMRRLVDGGGIYTAGSQPDSSIHRNFISNQGAAYGNIYLDNRSAGFKVTNNLIHVATRTESIATAPSYWAYVQGLSPKAINNKLYNNFTNNASLLREWEMDSSNEFEPVKTYSDAPDNIRKYAGSPLASINDPIISEGEKVTVSSSSPESRHWRVVDGNGYNMWKSADLDKKAFFQVDLSKGYNISRIHVVPCWDQEKDNSKLLNNIEVRVSNDSSMNSFEKVAYIPSPGLKHNEILSLYFDVNLQNYRYVRVAKTDGAVLCLGEVIVHGNK